MHTLPPGGKDTTASWGIWLALVGHLEWVKLDQGVNKTPTKIWGEVEQGLAGSAHCYSCSCNSCSVTAVTPTDSLTPGQRLVRRGRCAAMTLSALLMKLPARVRDTANC
eukprot:353393-Chlamydomonas_euryale.AAC.7